MHLHRAGCGDRLFGYPLLHADVGNVCGPYLVRPGDMQSSEQVGKFQMASIRRTQVFLGVNGLKPHDTHQALDPFMVYRIPHISQERRHSWHSMEWHFEILLIHDSYQLQVQRRLGGRLVIIAGTAQP